MTTSLSSSKPARALALKKPSLYNVGTEIVNKTSDTLEKRRAESIEIGKLYLQHSFDSALQEQRQKFESRGERVVDDEVVDGARKEFGVDISAYKGISATPKEIDTFVQERMKRLGDKKIQEIINNPNIPLEKKKQMVLAASIAGGDTSGVSKEAAGGFFKDKKAQKPVKYADPGSSTGYRYAQPDENGRYIKAADDLEAPPDAGSVVKPKAASDADRTKAEALNNIASNYQLALDHYDSGFVGSYDSRYSSAKQYTPLASDKAANFKSGLAGLQNSKLHQLYGSRLTQTEIGRYALEGADDKKNEKDFLAKLYTQAKRVRKSGY
jgi:hypothetical protein